MALLKIPTPKKVHEGFVRLIEFYTYEKFDRAAKVVYATFNLKEAEGYLTTVVDKRIKVRNSYYFKLDRGWCKASRVYGEEVRKALINYEENADSGPQVLTPGEQDEKS